MQRPIMLGAGVATTCFVGSTLRRVWQGYTGPLFRGRRSSDNAERDIYASGPGAGCVDIRALLDFAAGGSVFITTIYNQDGSGRHLSKATTSLQPRIVNGGVIDHSSGVVAPRWSSHVLTGNPNLTNGTSPALTYATAARIFGSGSMLHVQVGHPAGAGTVNGACWMPFWTASNSLEAYSIYTDSGTFSTYTLPLNNGTALRSYVLRKQLNGNVSANTYRQNNADCTKTGSGNQTLSLLDGSSWNLGGYYNSGGSTGFYTEGWENAWMLFNGELAGDALKAVEATLTQHLTV